MEKNERRLYKLRSQKVRNEGQTAEDKHNEKIQRPYHWKERKKVKER